MYTYTYSEQPSNFLSFSFSLYILYIYILNVIYRLCSEDGVEFTMSDLIDFSKDDYIDIFGKLRGKLYHKKLFDPKRELLTKDCEDMNLKSIICEKTESPEPQPPLLDSSISSVSISSLSDSISSTPEKGSAVSNTMDLSFSLEHVLTNINEGPAPQTRKEMCRVSLSQLPPGLTLRQLRSLARDNVCKGHIETGTDLP